MPNWLGGSIEYDVDLKDTACGCNNSLLLVKMPGVDKDGKLDPSLAKDYYCDAN